MTPTVKPRTSGRGAANTSDDKYVDNTQTALSPLTGARLKLSVRAFCPNCGCLVSHKSFAAVQKAVAQYPGCKKCSCKTIAVKYTAEEHI